MEMLRNGTIGPKNCTRSRISVFQQNFSLDAIDFQDASYLQYFGLRRRDPISVYRFFPDQLLHASSREA